MDSTQHLVYSTATGWSLPVGQAVGMCSNYPGWGGGPGQAEPGASAVGPEGSGLGHSRYRDQEQRHFRGLTASNCNRKQSGKIMSYQLTGCTPDGCINRTQKSGTYHIKNSPRSCPSISGLGHHISGCAKTLVLTCFLKLKSSAPLLPHTQLNSTHDSSS